MRPWQLFSSRQSPDVGFYWSLPRITSSLAGGAAASASNWSEIWHIADAVLVGSEVRYASNFSAASHSTGVRNRRNLAVGARVAEEPESTPSADLELDKMNRLTDTPESRARSAGPRHGHRKLGRPSETESDF